MIQIMKYGGLTIAMLFAANNLAQVPQVDVGSLVHIASFSSAYVAERPIDIWLPEGYSGQNKYPVLYMHDGQMLFDAGITWNKQAWEIDSIVSQLSAAQKIHPPIVVAIYNHPELRRQEYAPQKALQLLTDSDRVWLQPSVQQVLNVDDTALLADRYLRFVVEELKPYVDSHFSTLSGREHTLMAGSSYGGLISLYAICEYPEVFGGVACLSTHWPGHFTNDNNPLPKVFLEYLRNHVPDPKTHRIYFDMGTTTIDALYEPHQHQADAILKAAGYNSYNWMSFTVQGAPHTENAWKERFHIPLQFLLGKE